MPVDPVRLKAVFSEALDRVDPVDRIAYLDAACAGDADLRDRVEALLRADTGSDSLLDAPAAHPAEAGRTATFNGDGETVSLLVPGVGRADRTAAPGAGTLIAGRYKLLHPIGEGGMGSVWMAEQTEPVKRCVAVKLIRTERGHSRTILSRFEAERQAIALMDHPHIAKLLDAGTSDGGAPFFVMELVKGVPLTEYCDAHRLSVPDRLKLFVQICGAVQHAHQKGIIHRDLKPSNILVESRDGKPVPRVIDFGLAKATSGLQLTEYTLCTGFGTVVGTPLYMAPEQATGNAVDADTRADVYALGVILYELLTGTTPLAREAMKKAPLDEVLRLIREQEAPAPSSRLSSSASKPAVAANRRTEPAKLGRFVRGDLDWIVLKALAKERDRRYETANGLARDVERFTNHEPVLAGPPAVSYRVRKFVRRNRGPVAAAGVVLGALVLGAAGTTLGLIEAKRQEGVARDEAAAKERALVAETLALEAEKEQRRIAEGNEAKAHAAAAAERAAKEREAGQRARAETAYQRTADVLDDMTSELTGKSLATQNALSAEQKKFLTGVLAYYKEFAAATGNDEQTRARTAQAAYRVGWIEHRLGRNEESAAAFGAARDGFERLATEFPAVPEYRRRLAGSHNMLGARLDQLGQRAEGKEQFQKALAIQEKLAAEYPAESVFGHELAQTRTALGNLLRDLGERAGAKEQYQKALTICEKLVVDYPAVPAYQHESAATHNSLGRLLVSGGQWSEGKEQFQRGLAIHEQLSADYPADPSYREDLARSHVSLGRVLMLAGQRAESWEQYQQALTIQKQLAADYPAVSTYRHDLAGTHHSLGGLLNDLGKRAEGKEQYQKALTICEKLAADYPAEPKYREDLAASHCGLGLVLVQLGQRAEGKAQYQKALAIQEKLAAGSPAVPKYRGDLAASHCGLGVLLSEAGQWAEAREQHQKALTIQEKLVAEFPAVPEYRNYLALSHTNLAAVLAGVGQRAEAREQYQKALTILERLVAEFPTAPEYRKVLALSYRKLGVLLSDLGQRAEAREQYQKALTILERLVAEFPTVAQYRQLLALSHCALGPLLADLGQMAEAREQGQKALTISAKQAAQFPTVPEYREDLAKSHNNLGVVFSRLGERAAAKEQYQKALAIREQLVADFPDVTGYRVNLGGGYCNFGILLVDDGQPAESLAWFDKAVRTLTPVHDRAPRDVTARLFLRNSHVSRAKAYDRLREYSEAVKDWDRGVELSPKEEQPGVRAERAPARALAGHAAEAVAEVADLTQFRGWNAIQLYNFARVYGIASGKVADHKSEYAERAMELLQVAVQAGYRDVARLKADPDLAALRDRDDFKALVAELEKMFPPPPGRAPPTHPKM